MPLLFGQLERTEQHAMITALWGAIYLHAEGGDGGAAEEVVYANEGDATAHEGEGCPGAARARADL